MAHIVLLYSIYGRHSTIIYKTDTDGIMGFNISVSGSLILPQMFQLSLIGHHKLDNTK